jgi:hypothetical protein
MYAERAFELIQMYIGRGQSALREAKGKMGAVWHFSTGIVSRSESVPQLARAVAFLGA